MDEELTERIALAVSRGLVRRIDAWRRLQADLAPRATAIRQLLEKALTADDVPRIQAPIPLDAKITESLRTAAKKVKAPGNARPKAPRAK